jgi:hypothetical protein
MDPSRTVCFDASFRTPLSRLVYEFGEAVEQS